MLDSNNAPAALPTDILDTFSPEELLAGVFATSITALALLVPLRAAAGGEITDFRFELLSEAAQRMLGQLARPNATHLQLTSGMVDNGIFAFYCEVFELGQPGQRDFNYQLNGFDAYFRLAARRVGAGLLVSFSDTADESRTPLEQVLRASQAQEQAARAEAERQCTRFYHLFMQAPAAICILNGPELVFELVNPRYQQLFPGRQLAGRPLLEALPELAGHAGWQALREVYETGKTHQENGVLIPGARHDGSVLEDCYFDYVLQARSDSQGHVDGVLVFAFEVTEQVLGRQQLHHANEELTAANQQASAHNQDLATSNRQLQRTNQDLDNFVYAASHDLKQPINNLRGLFDELSRVVHFVDSEEEILLSMVDESLAQLSTTVDDLALVGQVQQNVHQPTETVALRDLTLEVLQTLQPQVHAARARVTTDFTAAPTVQYSRANLRTILFNLLSNSLKYNDPARPCRVHLSLWKQAGAPVLLVEDNGLGFDVQRHQDELFQLFRRFHSHTDGTGVGLYLVNRIVQGNGGRIEVESEVGEGSTFRVYL